MLFRSRLVKRADHVGATHVRAVSEVHELCPFELNLDFARECDVIIADYNYGFDPRVRLDDFSMLNRAIIFF